MLKTEPFYSQGKLAAPKSLRCMIPASPSTPVPSTGDRTRLPTVSLLPFEVVGKTVLKWVNWPFSSSPSDRLSAPPTVLKSMQQLMGMIHRLRLLALSSQESDTGTWKPELPLTPENLVPYVSEEAYEVLDALEDDPGEENTQPQKNGDGENHQFSLSPSYLRVETLAPYLLWGVARSSYSLMQLIEGISIQRSEPNGHWVSGMLRLVVLLQSQTPTAQWYFDLATGSPPNQLLDENTLLQLKEDPFSMQNLLFSFAEASSSDAGIAQATFTQKRPIKQAGQWLEELLHQIQVETPALKPLLTSVSVECLQPGQQWQWARLQLKLGFEFMPQELEMRPQPALSFPDLIEAELLEETPFPKSPFRSRPKLSSAQVSIVELPRQALGTATLIRLTDQTVLDRYIQTTMQSQLATAISRLQQNSISQEGEDLVMQVVVAACDAMTRLQNQADWAIAFLHPQFLTSELIPRLLWHLTRSSYEVTQLLSGIEVQILQPGSGWASGILRLLAALEIQTAGMQWKIDLATRQFIVSEEASLHPDTLCQGTILSSLMQQSVGNPALQQSVQTKTLIHHLLQQIQKASPEMELLMNGVAIAWLEGDRNWQPGTLTLTVGLEFTTCEREPL